MNFAVIDIETVNNEVTGIATIGCVGVDKGEIVETAEFYVKPEPFVFDENAIAVNRLKEEDFVNAPAFSEIWDELSSWLTKYDFCVAHNASFDFGIIRACCEKNELSYVRFPIVDSYMYVKSSNLKLPNYKLDTICEHLDIDLCNRHNSLCDATATAEFMLKLIKSQEHHILDVFEYGNIEFSETIKPRKAVGIHQSDKKPAYWKVHAKDIPPSKDSFSEDNAFKNKQVVISGDLTCMNRATAYSFLKSCGADVRDNITLNTDYLITNSENMTGKIKKAKEYIERGKNIQIINEVDFVYLLKKSHINK